MDSIKPADYCVSLELAQDARLRKAMYSVGVVAEFQWSGILPEIDHLQHDWRWEIMHRYCVRVCPERRVDAYHIGELLIAAQRLADVDKDFRLDIQVNLEGDCSAESYNRDLSGRSQRPADALALLVIALHKEASNER